MVRGEQQKGPEFEGRIAALWQMMGREIDLDSTGTDTYKSKFTDRGWEVITGADQSMLNMACIYDPSRIEEDVESYAKQLQASNVSGTLFIPGTVASSHVTEVAVAQGFQNVGKEPLMECAAGNLYPLYGNQDIAEIHDYTAEAVPHAAQLQQLVFGFPLDFRIANLYPKNDYRLFIGRDKGKVVSTITTIETTPGEVGIWSMAVDSEIQKKGYGRELLHTVMNDHIQQGAKRFHLLSSGAGLRLYKSTGFQIPPGGETSVFTFNPKQ